MDISQIKNRIPAYAKDLKLNFASVLTTQGAPGLTDTQIRATALASAIASRNSAFTRELETLLAGELDAESIQGARAAAAIMGMNNTYYRFVHMADSNDFGNMPARLRMNVIASPGIDKAEFELYALAVSIINGCDFCVTAHEKQLRKAGFGNEAIQSAARIAAVIYAVASLLEYESGAEANRQAA